MKKTLKNVVTLDGEITTAFQSSHYGVMDIVPESRLYILEVRNIFVVVNVLCVKLSATSLSGPTRGEAIKVVL